MSQTHHPRGITRREVMLGISSLGAYTLAPGAALAAPLATKAVVPLPSADVIRQDYQRMVDFGPRLPGNPNHLRFVDFLARELQQLGLTLGPCSRYPYAHWDPLRYGLEVEKGDNFTAIPKVAYYAAGRPHRPPGLRRHDHP